MASSYPTPLPAGHKHCRGCCKLLPYSRFRAYPKGDGYQARCRECEAVRNRAARAALGPTDACVLALDTRAVARFWSKVDRSGGPETCWPWRASGNGRGYGHFSIGRTPGTMAYAHRVAWVLSYGPIPEGLEVCHNCPGGDNPRCVNPAHLWLGTHLENVRDMCRKGRRRPPAVPLGEAHHAAKLTEQAVREIHFRAAAGESQRSLARRFALSRPTIHGVIVGTAWRHVGD